MKKFFQILIWTLLIFALGAAMVFAEMKHRETICQGFDLVIIDQNTDPLIKASEIRAKVISITDTLIGKQMGAINLHEINDILEEIPYVLKSDIQTNISGYLSIEVSLRHAIVRIENQSGLSYYIDEEGWILPINPGHPARVIIASGAIKDGITKLKEKKIHIGSITKGTVINNLYEMSMMIDESAFLKKLITQIWVDKSGALELIPMLGEYTLKFGDFDGMEDKFEKLETFYREGAGKAGWIDYRSVDLRYKNQIICSKK
jgi:cell division protein FtsQ